MLPFDESRSLQERVAETERRIAALEASYEPITIAQLVALRARTHPTTIAYDFFERGQRATYADMHRLSNRYARALSDLGVRKGDRVAVMLPNRIEFVLAWFACAKLGAVIVPINMRFTPTEVEFVANDTHSKFAIVDESAWPTFAKMAPWPQNFDKDQVVLVGHCTDSWAVPLDALLAGADDSAVVEDVGLDADVMIGYTSGSTGFPKAFALTNDYFSLVAYGFAHIDYEPYQRQLCWSYLFYSFGQWILMKSLYQGATLYVAERLSSRRFADWVEEYGIEWCAMPELIARQPYNNAFKRLKQVRQYLGWSSETTQLFRKRYGVRGDNCYGLTETGNVAVFLSDAPEMEEAGAFGHRALFREVRLVSDDGSPTPVGEVGELWVRGPAMFKGYLNRREFDTEEFEGDWFKTGDLVRRNDLGFYWLVGRKREMFKRSGENIPAREVEDVIRKLPEIADVAAVPVSDAKRHQEVKICIELKEGLTPADLPVERILAHARERLAVFKVPRYIAFIDKMPRTTSSHKVLKRALMDVEDPLAGVYDSEDGRWR